MAANLTSKVESLNRKLSRVEDTEEKLETLVQREEKGIERIEKEEVKIERALLRIGRFTIKRSHVLELVRGIAGAFLGVGLGQALGGSVSFARVLPWLNTIGILIFVLVVVGILIYKNDKDQIAEKKSDPYRYVFRKLIFLYVISILVQLFGLILFDNFPGWNEILIKALIIGSYSAMSSAVAFTLL